MARVARVRTQADGLIVLAGAVGSVFVGIAGREFFDAAREDREGALIGAPFVIAGSVALWILILVIAGRRRPLVTGAVLVVTCSTALWFAACVGSSGMARLSLGALEILVVCVGVLYAVLLGAFVAVRWAARRLAPVVGGLPQHLR